MLPVLPPSPAAGASPFVQRPWVQLGDQRERGSLAVVWLAPDRDDAALTLEYGSGGRFQRARTTFRRVALEGEVPHRVVVASLTGLKAGAPVWYRVLKGARTVFAASTVAPKADAQPYTFAVFGDCGNGSEAQARVAALTVGLKPDFLLVTGDIVYSDGRVGEYRTNFFPQYGTDPGDRTNDPKLGSPLLSTILTVGVPGNHDIAHADLDNIPDGLAYFAYWNQPLNGPIADPKDPSATPAKGSPARLAAFREAAGANFPRMSNFSFDYGNAHWTCLDANANVDWTDSKLRRWVADDLRANRGKTWRFVSFHQPGFHSSLKHQSEKQMRLMADVFEDGGVDVVFSGHVHNYQRSLPIQVGAKRGASKAELAKDDWPVDRAFDGATARRPKGVVYIVDGAGGAGLYDPQLADESGRWKPYQAKYVADFSLSLVTVSGRTFSLRQIDQKGEERDRFTIEK